MPMTFAMKRRSQSSPSIVMRPSPTASSKSIDVTPVKMSIALKLLGDGGGVLGRQLRAVRTSRPCSRCTPWDCAERGDVDARLQPYSRTANESSGVGRRDSKSLTGDAVARHDAGGGARKSIEWLRQSMQMATPFCMASSPSARMTLAKPCVAQRMTWRFML